MIYFLRKIEFMITYYTLDKFKNKCIQWSMEIMKEQKLVYLTRRKSEIIQLKESLNQNSFELSQIIGHRLKGHGETFGFPQISVIGITMENAANEKNIEKLKEAIESLDENVEENLRIVNNM